VKTLELLKEKHIKEVSDSEGSYMEEALRKIKYSGTLLELRKKEQLLVK